jgi:acetoin utilization protein AcuB
MWMQQDVVAAAPGDSILDAAALMARKNIRRLPVLKPRLAGPPVLVGIVSATDILHAFPPNVNPFAAIAPAPGEHPAVVRQIMNRRLVTTTPETPIEEAAALLRSRKIGALPVVHEDRLVGIITESDIFRSFVSFLAVPGTGLRVTFDMSRGEDVFGFIAAAARKRSVRVISLLSSQQDDRPVCVVRLSGEAVERFMDDLWASGHTVLNVLRFPIL